MKNCYSKENLEGLVYDLIKYLFHTEAYNDDRLSEGVFIYCMNNRYSVNEEKYNLKIGKIPVLVEENVKVEDWLPYYNKEGLTLSMDCVLCEYLYYGDISNSDKVSIKIQQIFEKYGFYYDFETNWILSTYEIGAPIEFR